MKFARIAAVLVYCSLAAQTEALPPIPDTLVMPRHILEISNPDSLLPILYGTNHEYKLAAILRLGEVGNEEFVQPLIDAFNAKAYRDYVDVDRGVKYYSLIAIGRIGGRNAEDFLTEVVTALAPNLKATTSSFTRADSLMTLGAALRGLGEIGTQSAGAFLDSVFQDPDNTLMTRSTAYLSLLEIKVKNNTEVRTAADSAQFLIRIWQQVPWARTPFTAAGVSADYIVRTNVEALLYMNRSTMLPYVMALERELSADDPKLGALKKLRERMEAAQVQPEE